MKVLLFDGSNVQNSFFSSLNDLVCDIAKKKKCEIETLNIKNMKIGYCLGCFGCWTKTPGICLINDEGREIPKKMINSDLLIYLNPITFGGYSSTLKKALDRCIPVLLPFFRKVNGEVHHKMRYDKYPDILAIGVINKRNDILEKIFRNLINRNSINMNANINVVRIVKYNEDFIKIERDISNVFDEVIK